MIADAWRAHQAAPPAIKQYWFNALFRFLGLTGEDGWLSHQKVVLLVVTVLCYRLGIFSETLAAVLLAASHGGPLLKDVFKRIFAR
jgi:hypothetical protein